MQRTGGRRAAILSLVLVAAGAASAQTPAERREQARRLQADGNFNEAYEALRAFVFTPGLEPEATAQDLHRAADCLRQLNRVRELDEFLEAMAAAHPGALAVLHAAAREYLNGPPFGFRIAGAFERGGHRGGGEAVSSLERDRVRALQLLAQALPGVEAAGEALAAGYFQTFAEALLRGRNGGGAWRLQELTALDALPDFEPGHAWGWGGADFGEQGGAPVDEADHPVFHAVPSAWETAAGDGERWRWILAQWERRGGRQAALEQRAEFALAQFGTETLAGYGDAFWKDEGPAVSGVWALHTLAEDETIARLATGARRFRLPPDYDYLRLARELSATSPDWADRLARLFENRRQFPAAARAWQAAIDRHGEKEHRRQALEQIVRPWARIEDTRSQTSSPAAATFDLLHRNARRVEFKVRRVAMDALIADLQALLESNPEKIEHWQTRIEQLGYRMVEGDGTRYLREDVAAWTHALEPREHHFDRRETIAVPRPLPPGAYLVSGRVADGNETRAILWVADTAILRKDRVGDSRRENLLAVVDAETGAPVPGAALEFFRWRQQYNEPASRRRRIEFITERQRLRADAEGLLLEEPEAWRASDAGRRGWQTMAVARTPEGRFAFLGFDRVWRGGWDFTQPARLKPYGITDRPVYRPGQTVRFKIWTATADYGADGESPWSGRKIGVVLRNPKGEEIFDKTYVADAFGGVQGDIPLAEDAPLGVFLLQVRLSGKGLQGAGHFRVEEYRKPEFEVTVEAPDTPVALGERVEATVQARYTFGAPVTQGRARIRVTRTAEAQEFWPVRPWDWLYGCGYAWFGYDYAWYPGWSRWGLARPSSWRWWRPAPPPEVVLTLERPLNPDGTVTVAFDTALAKALYGDTDHRYVLSAEVTDLSRRTVVGQGAVHVARDAFRVTAWVDRAVARVGDDLAAQIRVRTPDGKPVRGTAELTLFRVTGYDPQGAPREEAVQSWTPAIDEAGEARQPLAASRKGQYRLLCRVTDAQGRVQEGGQVFLVRGDGDDGRDYRFADLELVPDRAEYRPGDTVRLSIRADAAQSAVLLFERAQDGMVRGRPRWIRLDGKMTEVALDVREEDSPNFFVEALTVRGGRVHSEVREIVVPPERRVLQVEILPDAARVLPGGEAAVTVRVTDAAGAPCAADVALSVYDKAVDAIAGGSNVPEIRAFFWDWRRRHRPWTQHTLDRTGEAFLWKDERGMEALGLFGAGVADDGMDPFGGGGGPGILRGVHAARKAAPRVMAAAPAADMNAARGMAFDAVAAVESPAAPEAAAAADPFGAGGGAEAVVRSEFADTAHWSPTLEPAGAPGVYRAVFRMPDDLTGWKARAWAMGAGVRVGEAQAELVTAKNIMLRLQAPRFFTQRDEVVLSANVHNFLDEPKTLRAVLELEGLDGAEVERIGGAAAQDLAIEAGGERRVDWRVRVTEPGRLTVRMRALTDVESDAMERTFPVQVHGMLRTEAWSGVVRDGRDTATVRFRVPEARRAEQTRLEVRWSPTLAGAMLDALPYLLDYPYGCTEQTLNRFLPAAVTRFTLRELGTDLAAIRERLTNLNPQELGDDAERRAQWKRLERNPVFDDRELDRIVAAGIERLRQMQLGDGGWGWFSGFGEWSDAHSTATVVRGLKLARAAGAAVPDELLARGVAWLRAHQEERVRWIGEKRKERRATALDALTALTLADEGFADARLLDWLHEDRGELPFYAKALLGLAFDQLKDDRRTMLLRNCLQFLREDPENQTAWFELGNGDCWWHWYGSETEAQACGLLLLVRMQPESQAAAGLVKYLLNNRKHATYWNSTRDTALCIEALAAFLRATGEAREAMTVSVTLDGERLKTVAITPERLFDFDNACVVAGAVLGEGEHELVLERQGPGPLYYNAYLENFTLEEPILAAGLEVKLQRRFYRLRETEKAATGRGARGQGVAQRRAVFVREPLADPAEIASGDLLEIELEIESKNDYEHLVLEDMKAAGCEPVELRSGYTDQGLRAYVEYRDNRAVFFVRRLARGRHSLAYRLRAESPGRFSALPARAWAMYAPELRANSDEHRLAIEDAVP